MYSAITRKVSAIKKLKEPSNIGEIHHFLGLTGYYRKYIPFFTNVTKPLNKFPQKDTTFQWVPQCQTAFKHIKQALCMEPILQYPSPNIQAIHIVHWCKSLCIFQSPHQGSWKILRIWICSIHIKLILGNAAKVACNWKGCLCSVPVFP